MREIEGWNLVSEAGERKSLPKGIYSLKITNIVDNPEREFLEVYYDIVEGEYKDYFTNLSKNIGRDASKEIRSYKTNALPFFKGFITAVEHSNPGYKWDWNEKGLVGKFVVGVFGEEEYEKDGEVKVSVKLQEFRSLEAMREGKIKVPEIKKLVKTEETIIAPKLDALDDVLPF